MAHLDEKGLNKVSGILREYIDKKVSNIVTSGDGTKFLNDKGEYKEINAVNIEEVQWYGIEWKANYSSPLCNRIGNLSLHRSLPIQNGLRGCVVKDGVVNYYLDPNDWSKKEDGTPSVLDGTDGVVRVDTGCTFYGKSEEDGNLFRVKISTKKIDDSWTEIPRLLIDAYRCTIDTTNPDLPKAVSVVNTTSEFRGGGNRPAYDEYLNSDPFKTDLGKPRTGIESRAEMRTYARNNDSYILSYEYYKWIFYWLPIIEFANFDSQSDLVKTSFSDFKEGGLGIGVTNVDPSNWGKYNKYCPLTPCGYTNKGGNQSHVESHSINDENMEVDIYPNRYRGFENPFGDIWTTLDGVVLEPNYTLEDPDWSRNDNVWVYDNPEDFSDTLDKDKARFIGIRDIGTITEFKLQNTAEIVPAYCFSGPAKCDVSRKNYTDKIDNQETLFVGGCTHLGSDAGLCAMATRTPDCTKSFYGFRTFCFYDKDYKVK